VLKNICEFIYTRDVVRLLHGQPPTVAIFREAFLEVYIAKNVKTDLQFENI
jgi:hypothetical protein